MQEKYIGMLIVQEGHGFVMVIQSYFRNIADSVSDHPSKVNTTIKQVVQMFWIPNARKSYVYTIV